MKLKTVPSSWMRRDGQRLDCGPYVSGALEAKIRLEAMACRKDSLSSLCMGGVDGIYHAGRESRTWVDNPKFGVPFLSSSSILAADLSELPLISMKRVASNPRFTLRRGWTLITRSGTIGRMVYARPDMDGLACSEHVMRVVPDPDLVEPGYLFAFLSSKFGVPLVTSGTYGSIIQSIESQHVADLPVPRLEADVEERTSSLVESASTLRVTARDLIGQAISGARELFVDSSESSIEAKLWSRVSSSRLQARCDAYYFSERCQRARRSFDSAAVTQHQRLGRVAEVFIPGIFKRRYADDPRYGVPYITGGDVFESAPKSERYLMQRVVDANHLRVERGTLLIQEAGQLGGLIGRSVMVGTHLDGFAVSNNMVRVKAHDARDAGFLFALLSTEEGVTLVGREAAGSSIPHLEAGRLRELRLPWPEERIRRALSGLVEEGVALRDRAISAEDEARTIVERAIEAM